MKIKKLNIKNWQQFENFELDFTYPEGHKLSGQPLNKICFIGPNGVGKSKILKLFYDYCNFRQDKDSDSSPDKQKAEKDKADIHIKIEGDNFDTYFVTNFSTTFGQTPPEKQAKKQRSLTDSVGGFNFGVFVEYVENEYRKKINKFSEIVSRGNITDKDTEEVQSIKKIFDKYLSIFNSDIKWMGFDTNRNQMLFDVRGESISLKEISSGIRDTLIKFFYLDWLGMKDYTVLIDEPENSLFPDIQKKLIEMYTSVGEDNQFFFATHSPLIASQFEPCEIFPLDFDTDGKVTVKNRQEQAKR